jgi:dihydroorotate dehydrogenase (fumarate)
MADLTTKYMGLVLKNPVIIGSCGITSSVVKIKELESEGAGAVVLKSLFEEEIMLETMKHLESAQKDRMMYTELSETLDYIDLHIHSDSLNNYLNLIRNAKNEVLIPVIASINCISDHEWIQFAKRIEDAGADALELNIFLNPADNSDLDFEKIYLSIIRQVLKEVKIPVSVKLSPYFTRQYQFFKMISETGIKGMVLFNRFFLPDIDIQSLKIKEASIFSTSNDYYNTLRWIGILSGSSNCSLAASTGIHDIPALIKQILAGADAVHIVSAIYQNGPQIIGRLLTGLENWMREKEYNYIDQFKGLLSMKNIDNPAIYERKQFMKFFGGIS